MNPMLKAFYAKPLSLYLAVTLLLISAMSGPAEAMFIPAESQAESQAQPATQSGTRAADLAKIQAALESKVVRQALIDNGLPAEEAMIRMNKLSDEQVHQLATHADSLQAGGDPLGFLVGVVVLALLVVVLIFLLEGRIQIR
jgi:hypothetical protein